MSRESGSTHTPDVNSPAIAVARIHAFVGDSTVVSELLRTFRKELVHRRQVLAADLRDTQSLKSYAHSLRGTAATIFADRLAAAAGQIETALVDDQVPDDSAIDVLQDRITECLDFIEDHLRRDAAA